MRGEFIHFMEIQAMRTMLRLLGVAILLMTPGVSFAMDDLRVISREQVKKLGIEVCSKSAGPDAVWVELAFDTKGDLQKITHVRPEMWAGKKCLLSSILRDNRPRP